jgi:hypothetical protein
MGCGCSHGDKIKLTNEVDKAEAGRKMILLKKMTAIDSKRSFSSCYHLFQFKRSSYLNNNLLIFTTMSNLVNDFISLDITYKDKPENLTFKSSQHNIAVGYNKGYKLDMVNQDKFFVLLDGIIEIYCLIDGHGPFGNIVAQVAQDAFFKVSQKFTLQN